MKTRYASYGLVALLSGAGMFLAGCAEDPAVEEEAAPRPRAKQASREKSKPPAPARESLPESNAASAASPPPAGKNDAASSADSPAKPAQDRVKELVIRSGPLNPLAQAMYKSGVVSCLDRINQVSNFVFGGYNSGAAMFVAPQAANAHISSASMEILPPRELVYASADFAPYGTGECGAVYETVTYWPAACDDVAKQQFAQAQNIGPLKSIIATLSGGPNLRIFLMPAGKGCVAIKKEVIY